MLIHDSVPLKQVSVHRECRLAVLLSSSRPSHGSGHSSSCQAMPALMCGRDVIGLALKKANGAALLGEACHFLSR